MVHILLNRSTQLLFLHTADATEWLKQTITFFITHMIQEVKYFLTLYIKNTYQIRCAILPIMIFNLPVEGN